LIPPSENTNPNQDLYAMGYKRTLCIDFDGVLHFYGDGWKGPTEIYDIPVPGAIEWLKRLLAFIGPNNEQPFEVAIYSSRSKHEGGVEAMKSWLLYHGLGEIALECIIFPTQKPAAWITIDDRCFQFRGVFPSPEYLLGYEAWNKRPIAESIGNDVRTLREIADTYKQFPEIQDRLERIANELEGQR